jgi:hypothetical protein
MTPVVSKTLAIGLATLYIAGMTTALLGGVVPAYETRAGGELSERVLATAAGEIERAPPAVAGSVERQTTLTLPETIANDEYRLKLSNSTLALVHPDGAIERETHLSLPPAVTPQNSTVSGGRVVIEVSGSLANRTLGLGDKQ